MGCHWRKLEGDIMALVMKNGSVTNSNVINTGLSSIKEFIIYRNSVDSTGLILGHYNSILGTHYTIQSMYSTTYKYISVGNEAPTISGGKVTWTQTNLHALASGKIYYWIAYGDE